MMDKLLESLWLGGMFLFVLVVALVAANWDSVKVWLKDLLTKGEQ